ncbi:MAG: helix-turn-helix domain-containing protein, partial [Solirubrobacteraceae bacterium]
MVSTKTSKAEPPPPAARRTGLPAGVEMLAPAVIGARVKALRESASLSLRELALRSGVSAPMLSQVERRETSPTIAVAAKIAAGLELSLSQLLRLDERPHIAVTRAGQGRTRRKAGHLTEELTPALPGQRADVSRHSLKPGAAT